MVVTSVKHLGGILAPTMSIVARNPTSRNSWESDEITRAEDIIEEVCGNVSDIKQCFVKETYDLADLVEYAHIGFIKGTLQKNGNINFRLLPLDIGPPALIFSFSNES